MEKVAVPAEAFWLVGPERVAPPGLAPIAIVTAALDVVTVFAPAS